MATSGIQSGFVDSWQRGKSVIECNRHMLDTEDFTDVTFLVGTKKHVVRAHRYVLASRSCVFHAMFRGRMAEQGEITIPDIEVNVFQNFLRFLYTDSCTINSENVAGLLYTSRKYDVETLFRQSAAFLEESLSEDNLCEILEKSHGYGETDLELKALKMLSQAGPKVVTSIKFLELCSGCFGTFLNSENLNLGEEEVFEKVLSWTKHVCDREGLNLSHENMRKILGAMVYEIRFASFSLEFLTKVVGPSGLLTRDERLQIMDRISDTSVDISPFKTDVRKKEVAEERNQDIHYVSRFQSHDQPSLQGGRHSITFCTSKDITLLGCQMYGSDFHQTIKLDIRLFDGRETLIAYPIQNTELTLSNFVNDVLFPKVSITAGHVYTINVKLSHDAVCYSGSEGQSKMTVGGVDFTFIPCRFKGRREDVKYGQIPGLIWKC